IINRFKGTTIVPRPNGRLSINCHNAEIASLFTIVPTKSAVPATCIPKAEPPLTVNQTIPNTDGRIKFTNKNSLIVLPCEIIAKNIPVTGAYAIQQAQSNNVHD